MRALASNTPSTERWEVLVLMEGRNGSRVMSPDPARGPFTREVSPPTVTQLTSRKQERRETNCVPLTTTPVSVNVSRLLRSPVCWG